MDELHPITTLERSAGPLARIVAILLLAASAWGLLSQAAIWNRPSRLAMGTAGPVEESRQGDETRYRLPFREGDTNQELTLWLPNDSPLLSYFLTRPVSNTLAVRYWTDDLRVISALPLEVGATPVRDRFSPTSLVLATSILGTLLAVGLFLSSLRR